MAQRSMPSLSPVDLRRHAASRGHRPAHPPPGGTAAEINRALQNLRPPGQPRGRWQRGTWVIGRGCRRSFNQPVSLSATVGWQCKVAGYRRRREHQRVESRDLPSQVVALLEKDLDRSVRNPSRVGFSCGVVLAVCLCRDGLEGMALRQLI